MQPEPGIQKFVKKAFAKNSCTSFSLNDVIPGSSPGQATRTRREEDTMHNHSNKAAQSRPTRRLSRRPTPPVPHRHTRRQSTVPHWRPPLHLPSPRKSAALSSPEKNRSTSLWTSLTRWRQSHPAQGLLNSSKNLRQIQ